MNIQRMLVQRDSVPCAASALTTLSTEQDRRKRKVKQELPRPRKVTSAGSGVRGAGEVPPPPSDNLIARLQRPSYQRDFQPLALYGPHGVGCQLPAQDVLTLADGQCLADTVVDFHNMGHYSLVIATNLRTMVSGKLSETAEGGVELVHYDSAQLHTNKPEVMEGVKSMLLLLHKAQLPTADRKQAEDHVKYAEVYVMHPEDHPQQSNAVDCGIYVGMYLRALVSSGFSILKQFMTFYGAKSHAYRRQLREEVSLHATGDLIVKLFGEGVEVPVQPLPQVGEHGALVFPKEDEVRTDLARQHFGGTTAEWSGTRASGTRDASAGSVHVQERRTGQQIRLGAYTVELDAAYAYAAAAFVIRRNDHIQHVKELTDEEKECLEGCVRDDVRHLVKARMWWRWRQWRTALAELGIEPGTPFPLENSGTRSPDNSSSDEDVQVRMGHGVETVCD
ncbi:unnamed protein product [Closterium sp. Yama58-4]|nr:unnamed protein product [Closterium sp. Yama58-4]